MNSNKTCYRSHSERKSMNITYGLKDHWMFDQEGVKTTKVVWSLSIYFSHVKSKIDIMRKKIWG